MNPQARLGQPRLLLVELDTDQLLAHLEQRAQIFLTAAVEQLHGSARCQAQDATDVMGLSFGQIVLAEGEWGVDKEAG